MKQFIWKKWSYKCNKRFHINTKKINVCFSGGLVRFLTCFVILVNLYFDFIFKPWSFSVILFFKMGARPLWGLNKRKLLSFFFLHKHNKFLLFTLIIILKFYYYFICCQILRNQIRFIMTVLYYILIVS